MGYSIICQLLLANDFVGEVAEWSNASDLKSDFAYGERGFKSHPLRYFEQFVLRMYA